MVEGDAPSSSLADVNFDPFTPNNSPEMFAKYPVREQATTLSLSISIFDSMIFPVSKDKTILYNIMKGSAANKSLVLLTELLG